MLDIMVCDAAEESLIRLTVFQPVLTAFIGPANDISVDDICEKVLNLQNLEFTFNQSKVVTKMKQL